MQLRDISVYSYETITVRASVLRGPELDLSAVIVQFVIKLYLNKTIYKSLCCLSNKIHSPSCERNMGFAVMLSQIIFVSLNCFNEEGKINGV